MSILITPQERRTSEIPYHSDRAPGRRLVFVGRPVYPPSALYIVGRRVEYVPKDQPEWLENHRHNCNTFYVFSGDRDDLSGLRAIVTVEGKTFEAHAPATVLIPQYTLHHYKLVEGSGWSFHVNLRGDYEESLAAPGDTDASCSPAPHRKARCPPQGTGRTVDVGVAIGAAFARQMTDKLSWAVHIRWVQETLDEDKISTFDIDFGILFYTGFRSTRIAMSLKNFGRDSKIVQYNIPMPLYFNVGLDMEAVGKKGEPIYLTASVESAYATDFGERVHVGGEFWLQNTLALRAGYKFNYDIETFSAGVGVKRSIGDRSINVDFSYSDIDEIAFDPSLRFSLGGTF